MRASAARSRPGPEPALGLAELLQLKWAVGGMLGLLSMWTVFFFELSGTTLLPAATAAIVLATWRPDLAERVPAVVWRLAFPLLVAFVAVDLLLNGEALAAFIRLNLLLIVVRATGPRRRREDLQLLALCLILAVVAGVLTVSIGFAVQILVFTAAALGHLLLITLTAAVQGDDPVPENWRRVAWLRLLGRVWRATEWRFVGVAAPLFLLVVAVATVLFLAIPRFQIENALGFLQLRNRRALSGFSDTVRIGDVTDITQDDSVAMRVEVSDPTRVPGAPYWRMVVLDAYHDGTFRVSRGVVRTGRALESRRDVVGIRPVRAARDAPVWTCYFEPGISRYVPLTGEFVRVRLREAQPLTVDDRAHVLELRQEPQTMFAYRAEGMDTSGRMPAPGLAAALGREPAAERVRDGAGAAAAAYPHTLVEVPAGAANAAVLDRLVAEISPEGRLGAEAFAARATEWLARHHRYSLQSRLPAGAEDPVVRWLAGGTPGHCELFAAGFALLARRAGFPVRIVAGFHGGTWNAFEGYFMVRNSDAHAWCEVFDGRGTWFRVDPTPAAGEATPAAAAAEGAGVAVDRTWSARFDSVRMIWYRRIVSFDKRAQDEAFDTARSAARRTGQALVARLERLAQALRSWLQGPWDVARSTRVVLVVAACTAVAWAVWRFRFATWAAWRRGRRGDPVRRLAGRWLQKFAAAGLLAHDTALVRDLQRLRFGPLARQPDPLAVFGRARRVWRNRNQG